MKSAVVPLTLSASAVLSLAGWCAGAQTPLTIDYETGTTNSGITNLTVTHATAPDAAYLVTDARAGQYAIAHKVTLGDDAYVSDGYPRSESSTEQLFNTAGVYYDNTHGIYGFSLQLRDFVATPSSPDEDIIWQFKHNGTTAVPGRHDIALGVQRDNLMLHWDGNTSRIALLNDISDYNDEWIDFRFDIVWASDDTGQFTMTMRLPGETDFGHAVTRSGYDTFDATPGAGTFGYLKWGVYRNDGNLANGDQATRIVYHDDITATVVPEPTVNALSASACILLGRRRRRQRRGDR
jgi:hypothetical protein